MAERKVFKFKLEPRADQEHQLNRFAGARRFVYNWGLERSKTYYRETGKGISWKQLSEEFTALKSQPGFEWLQEMDSQALQQALADLKQAFIHFFEKRARYPRFKSRKDTRQSFRIPQRVKVEEGRVYVPKIGWIKIRQSQPVDCPTKSATFKRDACGHWFVTLVAEFQLPEREAPKVRLEDVAGGDVGLNCFLALSTGAEIDNPRFYRAAEGKLRRAQRRLSRRQKGSRNRAKARIEVAKVHQDIANQRADFTHKLSFSLICSFLALSFESLNARGLARTKLAKSVLDAAWGLFFRQAEYKGRWYNRHVVFVGQFFPSTRRCSECGQLNEELTLSDREWDCPDCRIHHHRDKNAAKNLQGEGFRILVAAGHAETQNACGASVRLSIREQLASKQESRRF
jgi:putative transposase